MRLARVDGSGPASHQESVDVGPDATGGVAGGRLDAQEQIDQPVGFGAFAAERVDQGHRTERGVDEVRRIVTPVSQQSDDRGVRVDRVCGRRRVGTAGRL